jgi:hypothetical protein
MASNMEVLLPLSNLQRSTLLRIPSDCNELIQSQISPIFEGINLGATHTTEELISTLENHGNWLYNYMLLEIRREVRTSCNNTLSTLSRLIENSLVGVQGFRYVWLYSDTLKLSTRSLKTYGSEKFCLKAGRKNPPTYDSNDGIHSASTILGMETDTDIAVAEHIAMDGFAQLQLTSCCILRRSPWYMYTVPPTYHYQIVCRGNMTDSFSSDIFNLLLVRDEHWSGARRRESHNC